MSTAGPAGWKPPPVDVGLARGPRISVPKRLNTLMSGVNGLLALKVPPPIADVWSLQTLGKPRPDSRTYTWKLCELPRNAIPVGKLRPVAKTETLNPAGTTMSLPVVGIEQCSVV